MALREQHSISDPFSGQKSSTTPKGILGAPLMPYGYANKYVLMHVFAFVICVMRSNFLLIKTEHCTTFAV